DISDSSARNKDAGRAASDATPDDNVDAYVQDLVALKALYGNNHLSDVLFVFSGTSTSRSLLENADGANADEPVDKDEGDGKPEHHLIPAHRLVLALRSGTFHAAFLRTKSSQVPSQVRFPIKIHVQDTSFEVFATLLRFLYTNDVKSELLAKEDGERKELEAFWRDLLRAAFVYLVPSLVTTCVQHIIRLLETPETSQPDGSAARDVEIKQLKKIFEILVFSDAVLATRQSAAKRRASKQRRAVSASDSNQPLRESVNDNADGGVAEEWRGLAACTASIVDLQRMCMQKLEVVPDRQFEALLHSDVGKRCSTERICDILRQRSKNPLVVAIRYQLGRVVNELLKGGEPLETVVDGEELPLVAALATGNDAIIRRLLVDENAPFFLLTDKIPLLLLACASGNVLHCEILLNKNHEDVNLISPLESGDKDILSEFGRRQTPLHLASRKGHAGVAKLLLENKAVPNLQDEEGNTPLHCADNMETADVLLRSTFKSNPNIPNRRGQTPLHVAAARGNVGIVDLLLRHNADIEIVDDQGQSAFHVAAANGHTSVALVLLRESEFAQERRQSDRNDTVEGSADAPADQAPSSHGSAAPEPEQDSNAFNINQEDLKGNTALHLAAMSPSERCQKMIQLLVENGADPNHTNWFGYTPLHLFCSHQSGPASAIDIFIEHGAKIHSQSLDGSTALHLAVGRASESVAVALVIAGAHVHLQDAAGRSVVDLAESTNQGAMLVPVLRNLAHPPEWVADDQARECSSCHTAFGVAMRKHHCRHCGRILCYNCSSHKTPIAKFQLLKPVRVCDTCFDVLSFRKLL
ncbi:TPA: hypothetical protein N0F65_010059, partial [Lagenidium giganteum]